MTTRGFIGVGRKGISVRYFSSSRVREKVKDITPKRVNIKAQNFIKV
jgi:hypothetical protein